MEALRRLKLRRQAKAITVRSLAFAAELRSRDSEFANGVWEPYEAVGDELATLARAFNTTELERRAMVAGLEAGLRELGLSATAQIDVMSRLAPRIMLGVVKGSDQDVLRQIAV